MTKNQIIEFNNSLGFSTQFFKEDNGIIGYNENGVIFLNEFYEEDLVVANKHELLHNYEETKSFKFMKRAILGYLGKDLEQIRKEYTLKYAGLYSEQDIKNGYLDNEIVIDFIVGNGKFNKNIKDIFPRAFEDLIRQRPSISANRKFLNITLSKKIEQQFPNLSKWEKIFVLNYYNGKDKILPTNKQTKYQQIRADIQKELNRLYDFSNNFLNFRIDTKDNPELEREFDAEIQTFIARGDEFSAKYHLESKNSAMAQIASTIEQNLYHEYKHIVDFIKNESYEPAFKALMLSETLTKVYRQIKENGQVQNIVEKRDIKKSLKGHMTLNKTTLDVIYENLNDYSNFANLYFDAINVFNEVVTQKSSINLDGINTFGMGKWIKFEGKSSNSKDYVKNAQTLASLVQSTPWCTKQLASTHLSQGDFYVFVDNDNNPHIAVKMQGNEIDEVRGLKNDNAQELEDDYRKVAMEFLEKNKNIRYGKEWLEKEEWNQRLVKYQTLFLDPNTNLSYAQIIYDLFEFKDYKAHSTKNSNLDKAYDCLGYFIDNHPDFIDYVIQNSNVQDSLKPFYAPIKKTKEIYHKHKIKTTIEKVKNNTISNSEIEELLCNVFDKKNKNYSQLFDDSVRACSKSSKVKTYLAEKFNCDVSKIIIDQYFIINDSQTPNLNNEPKILVGNCILCTSDIKSLPFRYIYGGFSSFNSNLKEIKNLEYVNALDLYNIPTLTNLDNLRSVGFEIKISYCNNLIQLPNLETADTLLVEYLSCPKLKSCNKLIISQNAHIEQSATLDYSNLQTVQELEIQEYDVNLCNLVSAKKIIIENSKLKSLENLEKVDGRFVVDCCEISNLGKLKYVENDLNLSDCPNLSSLDSLEFVGGDMNLCESITSLKNLREVRGQVKIKNPQLKEQFEREFVCDKYGIYHRIPEFLPTPNTNEETLQA